MPVCARPVRTLERSFLNASMLLPIFCSVLFFSSGIIAVSWTEPSYVNQGPFVLPQHDSLQRVLLEDAEDADGKLLVPAQGERSSVHHPQVTGDGLVEADSGVALCAWIALRIGGIHAVH